MANNNLNGDQLKAKRIRSANWDTLEKSLLKSCMKEFVSILENKKTDTNTNKNKAIAWQAVAKRFNELNNRERQITEIKHQWRNMKLDAKKNMSQIKTSIKCTGGGSKPPSTVPQEFETDSNVFDNDSIVGRELARERHNVLVNCLREEHDVKIKNMSEAHSFIKEEHHLKMKQIILETEETKLRIEKLKLEMMLLESKLS